MSLIFLTLRVAAVKTKYNRTKTKLLDKPVSQLTNEVITDFLSELSSSKVNVPIS